MARPKTVVIIKKVKAHPYPHTGAWKVAYADFVTALMSLFIVLWLMNTSPSVRQAVAGYFNNPRGLSTLTGTNRSGSGDNLPITRDNIKTLKVRLEKSIHGLDNLKALSNQIEITVTPEGLRIELLETKDGSFFETGSAKLNAKGREILTVLARELGQVPNRIMIEGHTDARTYPGHSGYSNWDLSTDRANSARRLMQANGLRPNQVSQVRGYADQMLRVPSNPYDPSNRRITLIVQYIDTPRLSEASASEALGKTGGGTSPPSTGASHPSGADKPSPAIAAPNGKSRHGPDGLAVRLWDRLRYY